jgi:hypothetical protein
MYRCSRSKTHKPFFSQGNHRIANIEANIRCTCAKVPLKKSLRESTRAATKF